MYACILLHEDDAKFLADKFLEVISDFSGYRMATPHYSLPHHMTINMGDFDQSLNDKSVLGQEIEMYIDGFSYSNELGIAAARVVRTEPEINTINEQPHITIAIQPHGKPFLSNKLDWENQFISLNRTIAFSGVVTVLQ